ncbi:MAG: helix-turn-helix transcriptional regulator [Bacteroidia bacterium]|jgi:predicted DNA-binding transcriptional regulator YafY
MPVNKDALSRYRIIDEALRNRQKTFPNKKELILLFREKLGIEVANRTLEEDLQNMRNNTDLGYLAPIAYHPTHKGYYYTDPDYTLNGLRISADDLEKLKLGVNILSEFQGLPYLSELRQPIEQLERMMQFGMRTGKWLNNRIVQMEVPALWPDKQLFATLLDAITQQQQLEISYQRFGVETPYNVIVNPFLLKEYRNRWYLVARNVQVNELRIYGLDRMPNARRLSSYYDEHFDSEAFFQYALGITVYQDEIPEEVELLFDPDDAPYVLSNPLHHSQRILQNDNDGLRISLNIFPSSYELRMLIRSYGHGVQVLKPERLAGEIAEDARKTLALYRQD